jgi:hypothetical protein
VHFAQVPNYPHGTGSKRHVEAFRMWIDHIFFQRPLSEIEVETPAYRAGRLTCVAKVSGKPRAEAAKLYYVTTDEPNYLRSVYFMDAPAESFVRAKWQAVAMRREGDRWLAEVQMPPPAGRFAACFVDVTDTAGRTRGYASSTTLWLEDSALPSPKLRAR